MKAKIEKEIQFQTPNEPGTVAKVTSALSKQGVNILSFCAWSDTPKNEGNFALYTDNNATAFSTIKSLGYTPKESEVVVVELPNKPGAFSAYAKKLGDAEVDIFYTYCTAHPHHQETALLMLSTNNNSKAVSLGA